ncbi:MAG: PEP-CTERM sorting domain-containing protein [Burkholderiales bacterium]|nr:MAG: PEP-CTERM sorting domain-containing protein [Burkholderiales bacterium]
MIRRLLASAALVVAALPSWAGTGVFGSYLAIDPDGPGAAAATWYGATQPGPATLTAFNGVNLGTFVLGSTATIAGGELLSWKNGTGNVTGGVLHWRVDSGTFQDLTINFTANSTFVDRAGNTFSNTGDQRWAALASTSTNFLAGVAAGAHTLQVYFTAFTNEGNRDSGSVTAPFSANFTVTSAVPEPGSAALLLAGMGLIAFRRRQWR